MGRGTIEAELFRSERYGLELRTTEPANHQDGELWVRTDLAPDTDQIATLQFNKAGTILNVPIYDASMSTNLSKALRIPINGTTGYIPLAENAGSFDFLRFEHNGAWWGVHDSPTSILTETAYHYPIYQRSNSTIEEDVANADATANNTTNTQGTWYEDYAEVGDGVDDYISMPSEIFNWMASADAQWVAFTADADPSDADYAESDVIMGCLIIDPTTNGWQIRDATGTGDLQWFLRDENSEATPINVETDVNVLDGTKKRIVVQRSGNNGTDAEIWVNGSQVSLTVVEDGPYNGNLETQTPLVLARELDGSPDSHLPSSVDNILFGDLGTTLSSNQIQDDYDRQPWS